MRDLRDHIEVKKLSNKVRAAYDRGTFAPYISSYTNYCMK